MKKVPSFTVKIWIAGDYRDACRAVRKFCAEGACFTVGKVKYIYTGGSESGVVVTRINYPRFPSSERNILDQCLRLAHILLEELSQDSFSIETPTETFWFTRRTGGVPNDQSGLDIMDPPK